MGCVVTRATYLLEDSDSSLSFNTILSYYISSIVERLKCLLLFLKSHINDLLQVLAKRHTARIFTFSGAVTMTLLFRADTAGEDVVVKAPLSPAIGYVVVVVLGLVIAGGMIIVTRILKKTVGEDNEKTEMFMTANRSVRTGLTTSAVISVGYVSDAC